jgi:hypothetical protein
VCVCDQGERLSGLIHAFLNNLADLFLIYNFIVSWL